MACKLLCESLRPETSTEPFVFMLKCCHLMDLINSSCSMLAAPLPAVHAAHALPAPESSAWLSQPCHTMPCWQHGTVLPAWWRWTSVSAQSSRADSRPQLPACSLEQNRRKCVMLLVLSFFHGFTSECFAEKHQELSSAAHCMYSLWNIQREECQMDLMCAVVVLNDNTQFFYLCSFYSNLPSSTPSEKPVAMELQAEIWSFS